MPRLEHGNVSIRYEDTGEGTGFPVLLLAPGAMNATVEAWQSAAYNPLVSLDGAYRLVSMDHRNAGQSTGPLDPVHPWDTQVRDQIDILDELGIEKAHVIGCCIGVSYALKMAEMVPDRVVSLVLEQPIGIAQENDGLWQAGRRDWAGRLVGKRADIDAGTAERFGAAMWDDREFVVSVSSDFVRGCHVPMLVLPGVDRAHPREIAMEIVGLAPDVTLVDPWKETPELRAAAAGRVRDFLDAHTPAPS
jgi:pimeloyl-ACP methyl ester carboxylesterase